MIEHPTIKFLKILFINCESGLINVRNLPENGASDIKPKNLFFDVNEDLEKIANEVNRQAKGTGCFVGIALRSNNNGTKNGIYLIPGLWMDHDNVNAEVEEKIKNFPLQPSITIQSSFPYKRQFYWIFKEPADKSEIERIETINRNLAKYLDGDPGACDASRVLRIPGSLNYKYGEPIPCQLIENNPGLQYSLEDFEAILPQEDKVQEKQITPFKDKKELILNGVSEGDRNNAITQLAGSYVAKRLTRKEILPILIDVNSRFNPTLEQKEVEKILDSVIKTHERNHPNKEALPEKISIPIQNGATGKHLHSIRERKEFMTFQDLMTFEYNKSEYLWKDILISDGTSILVAKPRVGKTTLGLNLAHSVALGIPFLGKETKLGKVLYIALEESQPRITEILNKWDDPGENLTFRFGSPPTNPIEELEKWMNEYEPNLVIIDTLQKFLKVKDLNDYAQVTMALQPVMDMARKFNCHIMLTHHAKKMETTAEDGILGSVGLQGGVDTTIHLKKYDAYRTFSTIQRYGENIKETTFEKRADFTLAIGVDRQEAEIEATSREVRAVLVDGPKTIREIRELVDRSKKIVLEALKSLFNQGRVHRQGDGKKKNPFVYSLAETHY